MRPVAILLFSLGLIMAGCATTKYDSTWQGGVEAERMDENRYLITAKGNRRTHKRTIEEFALLKAAETTAAHDKPWFKIVDADVAAYRTVSRFGSGTSGPHTATVKMTIEMVDEEPNRLGEERYYKTQEVLDTLGPKHLPKD